MMSKAIICLLAAACLGVCPKTLVGPRPSEKFVGKERGEGVSADSSPGRRRRRATQIHGASQPVESRGFLDRLLGVSAFATTHEADEAKSAGKDRKSADEKTEAKGEDGFLSIFDGKTLKGWEAMPAKTAKAWTVKDGMIVGDGDKGRGYLVYEKKQIADLELKLSYRFPTKGNSGISIRARKDTTGKREFQSYHADLGHLGIGKQVLGAWDFHTPGRREHACFRGDRLVIDEDDKPTVVKIEGAVTKDDIKKGDWNKVHVIAKGNNFKLFINGKLASEFTEHLKKEKRLESGMIQLQLHDPGMIVHFKDIRLKILK